MTLSVGRAADAAVAAHSSGAAKFPGGNLGNCHI
jgi:hypothetical protein